MFDRKQQNSVKQLSINKEKKRQRSTGDMQQKGTKHRIVNKEASKFCVSQVLNSKRWRITLMLTLAALTKVWGTS